MASVAAASFAAACLGHICGSWVLTGSVAVLATVSGAAWMPVLIASTILALYCTVSLLSALKAVPTSSLTQKKPAVLEYDPEVDLEREEEIAEYIAREELSIQEQVFRDLNKAIEKDERDHPFDPSDSSSVDSEEIQSWLEDEQTYVSGFDFVQEEERPQPENKLLGRQPDFPPHFTAQQLRGMQYLTGRFNSYPASSSQG